jgi:Holliday junction resolvase
MNKNYRRGREAEYRAKRLLEAAGYTVIRAAGSHGMFDLVALSKLGGRAIQIKTGSARVTQIEREAIKLFRRDGCPDNVTTEVWTWMPRVREPHIERVG